MRPTQIKESKQHKVLLLLSERKQEQCPNIVVSYILVFSRPMFRVLLVRMLPAMKTDRTADPWLETEQYLRLRRGEDLR